MKSQSTIDNLDVFAFFRMGLVTGLIDRAAVVAWADRRLLEQSDFALTELSLAGSFSYSRMIALLSDLQGPPRYRVSLEWLFALAGELADREPAREGEILRNLSLLCAEYSLPEEIKARLLALDGKSHDDAKPLREFLAAYAKYRDNLEELVGPRS